MSLFLELERWFPASPERVFAALTDIHELRLWYTCDPDSRWHFHRWDAEVGGALAVTIEAPGITVAVDGRFVEVVPARRLAYEWNDEFIELDLVADGAGTRIVLTHHKLAGDDERRIRNEGWGHNLASLTGHLTGHLIDHERNPSMTTEELVLTYWKSWQGSDPDWAAMRSCLADEIDTEQGSMPADQLVELASNGTPWRDVTMIEAIFADGKAAILYDGTDTATGETIRIAELLTVEGDKITKLRAAIPEAAGFG